MVTRDPPPASKASSETSKRRAKAPPEARAEPVAAAPAEQEEKPKHEPRFQFFIIDSGWDSASARVLHENLEMISRFRNDDPLFVLTREQSIALIRKHPDLIGKDPILLVHDLHAQGGRGPSGYHGFRLCLGPLKQPDQALHALQEFLRFIASHRHSVDIEQDIRQRLHRAGLEGAIEVIREAI